MQAVTQSHPTFVILNPKSSIQITKFRLDLRGQLRQLFLHQPDLRGDRLQLPAQELAALRGKLFLLARPRPAPGQGLMFKLHAQGAPVVLQPAHLAHQEGTCARPRDRGRNAPHPTDDPARAETSSMRIEDWGSKIVTRLQFPFCELPLPTACRSGRHCGSTRKTSFDALPQL